MGKPAACVGDKVLQDAPHCHAPIHPPAPVPTPMAHPPVPLTIIGPGAPTVMIGGKPAALMGDSTTPCMLGGCVPGGPGMLSQGSATIMIAKKPAVRANDMTTHSSCVAPIPAPTGKVMPPGCLSVMIGG